MVFLWAWVTSNFKLKAQREWRKMRHLKEKLANKLIFFLKKTKNEKKTKNPFYDNWKEISIVTFYFLVLTFYRDEWAEQSHQEKILNLLKFLLLLLLLEDQKKNAFFLLFFIFFEGWNFCFFGFFWVYKQIFVNLKNLSKWI